MRRWCRAGLWALTPLPILMLAPAAWAQDLTSAISDALAHAPAIAEHASLTVEVPGGVPLEFSGASRSTWTDAQGRTMVGFEFDSGQHPARARLALALFVAARPSEAEVVPEAQPRVSSRTRRGKVTRAA